MKLIKPDFNGNNIVNLMSSISSHFGLINKYKELNLLSSKKIKEKKNIVLLMVDGLGYDSVLYFANKNPSEFKSILLKNLKGSITSIFPSTTSAGVTSFATGLAPLNHGFLGWYMHCKEFGGAVSLLSLKNRDKSNIKLDQIEIIKSTQKIG